MARVEVSSTDEFGDLSAGFNQMAQTLQGLYQNLEAKVREKTERLEEQHQRLAALYEAAAFVARARSLEELGNGFARQLRTVAHADAAAIRWSDEGNQHYLMLASDGLPAEIAGGSLPAHPRVPVRPGRRGSQHPHHPDPLGRAEPDAGPLRPRGLSHRGGRAGAAAGPAGGRDQPLLPPGRRAGPDERALLETLAAHLAGAIEAFRLAALERESAVAQERSLLASELHDSIAQSLSFLKLQVGCTAPCSAATAPSWRPRWPSGGRRAGEPGRRARAAAALPHPHQQRGHRPGPARHAAQVRAADRTDHPPEPGRPGPAAGLGRADPGAAHRAGGALERAQARPGPRGVGGGGAPQWRFEIRDDGQGFDAEDNPADDTHVGLRIMRERAARIGAQVEVVSVPGSGTAIVLSLPEKSAAPATTT
jgi:two-component system nitrate/nitrite sensor histidine kinase NarX